MTFPGKLSTARLKAGAWMQESNHVQRVLVVDGIDRSLPPVRQAVAIIRAGRFAGIDPADVQLAIRAQFPTVTLVEAYRAVSS